MRARQSRFPQIRMLLQACPHATSHSSVVGLQQGHAGSLACSIHSPCALHPSHSAQLLITGDAEYDTSWQLAASEWQLQHITAHHRLSLHSQPRWRVRLSRRKGCLAQASQLHS